MILLFAEVQVRYKRDRLTFILRLSWTAMYTWLPVRDVCGSEDKPVKIREVTYFMKYIPRTRALIYIYIYIYRGRSRKRERYACAGFRRH